VAQTPVDASYRQEQDANSEHNPNADWGRVMRSFLGTLAALPVSLLLLAVTATAAQAHVIDSGTFFVQETEVNQVGTPECLSGDMSGIETTTFTTSGRFVQTGSGFHLEGMNAVSGRQVFTNGDVDVVDSSSPFSFNTTAKSGQTVSTAAGHELHTTFNAQGEVIARANFVDVIHTTYRDLNSNGQPDDGEVTSNFETFHVTCL